jgi:hypothetical protein
MTRYLDTVPHPWSHADIQSAILKSFTDTKAATILRSGPYRVYFYSHEPNEPPHVHVDRDKASCKVWRGPVALASSLGFRAGELREIERLVSMNRAILLKAWDEFHC